MGLGWCEVASDDLGEFLGDLVHGSYKVDPMDWGSC